MDKLVTLDLFVREGKGDEGGRRLELRVFSTDDFVAWFRSASRISDKETVTGVNMQLVQKCSLSEEQLAAAKEWLHQHAIAAL